MAPLNLRTAASRSRTHIDVVAVVIAFTLAALIHFNVISQVNW